MAAEIIPIVDGKMPADGLPITADTAVRVQVGRRAERGRRDEVDRRDHVDRPADGRYPSGR